jgi:hypothetical protein
VTKTTTIRPIAEQLQRPNSAKMVILRPRLFPEKVIGFSFRGNQFIKETIEYKDSNFQEKENRISPFS